MPDSPSTGSSPATFYAIIGGNDLYWRCEAPAKAIGAKTCVIPEQGGYYALTEPNEDSAFHWRFDDSKEDGFIEYPNHEGTAVWIRPDLCRATHAKAMRHLGYRTVAEVDDNYLSNPKLNIFMRMNRFSKEGQLDHLKSLASMNGIVFSTGWLRDFYAKKIRGAFGKVPGLEMFVARNNVSLSAWPERVESDGPVRVGWMGSPSHVWDVDLAWPALMHARNLGCETWMVGFDPSEETSAVHSGVPTGTSTRSRHKLNQWKKVGFKHIPWSEPQKYHRISLPLDIGLCPLLSNTHTFGKSDVKAIEYTIAGAAVIAQNNVVYNKTIRHGETGLLVGSPSEMLEAVELLVKNPRLREELVANAQQYVREERNLDLTKHEWLDAING